VQRFYLNLRCGDLTVAPDEEGAEFASIEEAYLESFKGAQELWPEMLRNRQDPRQYIYEITDGCGAMLMELPFAEVVECCRRVRPASMSALRPGGRLFSRRAFVEVLESTRNLNKKSADLRALLQAAMQSVSDLKESARAPSGVWNSDSSTAAGGRQDVSGARPRTRD
jgi:hypothetical protein